MQQLTLGSRVPTGTTWQLVNYLFSAKLNIARACVIVDKKSVYIRENKQYVQYDQYEKHEYEQYAEYVHLDAVVITIDKEPEKAYSSRGRISRE
ncbi:hypothetical protein T08_12727 [Trichinella sp. T8]|nr:hypothetical protein T08_12727 [Trichinella sp. T8]